MDIILLKILLKIINKWKKRKRKTGNNFICLKYLILISIERATSENIPGAVEDMSLNLDIADLIKSKKINAADAVNAFKKKLENNNPNVQLLTIKVYTLYK